MLNRDYNCDIDEDDLDDELGELEMELKAEKQMAKKKNINQPQQMSNNAWSDATFTLVILVITIYHTTYTVILFAICR